MRLSKTFNTEHFSQYLVNNEKKQHSLKLLVDDITINVSSFIASCWSDEFGLRADPDHEIFLNDFIGYKAEISDCVNLLHGREVNVSFSNIPVILKFADNFKIPELLDAAMKWFRENITTKSLIDVLKVLSDLGKNGYQVSRLIGIIRKFIEDNSEECSEVIKVGFEEDSKTIIDVLLHNRPLVKICIQMFNSTIMLEKDYEYFMERLECIVSDKDREILLENIDGINMMMDSVVRDIESPHLLKRWIQLTKIITTGCMGPSSSSVQFQAWRNLSKNELFYLKGNPKISEYQYAVMCVDWIETNEPNLDAVLELHQSMEPQKLEFMFMNCISDYLTGWLNYTAVPRFSLKLPTYEYYLQRWGMISNGILLNSLANDTQVVLSGFCTLDFCPNKKSNHTVNIRIVSGSGRASVEIEPLSRSVNSTSIKHTHDSKLYIHWYIFSNHGEICPFYTKSPSEITDFLNKHSDIYVRCLIRFP